MMRTPTGQPSSPPPTGLFLPKRRQTRTVGCEGVFLHEILARDGSVFASAGVRHAQRGAGHPQASPLGSNQRVLVTP